MSDQTFLIIQDTLCELYGGDGTGSKISLYNASVTHSKVVGVYDTLEQAQKQCDVYQRFVNARPSLYVIAAQKNIDLFGDIHLDATILHPVNIENLRCGRCAKLMSRQEYDVLEECKFCNQQCCLLCCGTIEVYRKVKHRKHKRARKELQDVSICGTCQVIRSADRYDNPEDYGEEDEIHSNDETEYTDSDTNDDQTDDEDENDE